jgi:hypothetical protein
MSHTRVIELVKRVSMNGSRAVRILYVSDFDPAGRSMPMATARKIEYEADSLGYDIQLIQAVLTPEQCEQYDLPRTPLKEGERRATKFEARFGHGATELDALEALYPGELRRILVAEIERFINPEFGVEWSEYVEEVQERLDVITEEVTDRLIEGDEEDDDDSGAVYGLLQEKFEALRELEDEVGVAWTAWNERVTEALTEATEDFEPGDAPVPPDADEWVEPLFESSRDYMHQMEAYRAWKGQELEIGNKTCCICGNAFVSKTPTKTTCSDECSRLRGNAAQSARDAAKNPPKPKGVRTATEGSRGLRGQEGAEGGAGEWAVNGLRLLERRPSARPPEREDHAMTDDTDDADADALKREKVRAANAKYRAEHPDKMSAARADWRRRHRAEGVAYTADWQKAHPDETRAQRKAFYVAHRDEILAKRKAARWAKKRNTDGGSTR